MAGFEFGQRLAGLRKKTRLSQKQLGQRLGKSTSTIGYYERDMTLPPLDTLILISEIFHVSLQRCTKGTL